MTKKDFDSYSYIGKAKKEESLLNTLDEIRPDKSAGFALLGIGTFFFLVGIDVISSKAYHLPPHYLIAALGASFLLTGLSVSMKSFGLIMHSPLHLLLRFCGSIAFLVPIYWVVFGDNPLPLPIRLTVGLFTALFVGIIAFGFLALRFKPKMMEQMVNDNPEMHDRMEREIKKIDKNNGDSF